MIGVAVLCWYSPSATEHGHPAPTRRFESSGKQSPPPVRPPQTVTSRAEPLFSQSLAGVRPPLNRSNSHALFGTCLGILGAASETESPNSRELRIRKRHSRHSPLPFSSHHLIAQPQLAQYTCTLTSEGFVNTPHIRDNCANPYAPIASPTHISQYSTLSTSRSK